MGPELSISKHLQDKTAAAASALLIQEEDGLRCLACAHRCLITEGKSGVCRMRSNRSGQLRVPWGYVAGLNVDPIEKKPFYHVLPGQGALSFGMLGCDFHCSFCQNWHSSQVLQDDQASADFTDCDPQRIVDIAVESGAPAIVSTYNEPLITADWAVEIFRAAQPKGLKCGFVSNGFATPEVIDFLQPFTQLFKVDLKSFKDENYRAVGGKLQPVLDTILRLNDKGFWVEIVTLVIPGFNDSEDELSQIAQFIAGVSPDIPWHVTAFYPTYKMREPHPTAPSDLQRAYDAGRRAGLHYIYAGNRPGHVGSCENTYCPECSGLLIERRGFSVLANALVEGSCPSCKRSIPGVWR